MVTALAVDKAGARVLTGGEDYKLRMFDFGGMKRDMRAFRTLEPEESYPVNAVSFSPTGAAPAARPPHTSRSAPVVQQINIFPWVGFSTNPKFVCVLEEGCSLFTC